MAVRYSTNPYQSYVNQTDCRLRSVTRFKKPFQLTVVNYKIIGNISNFKRMKTTIILHYSGYFCFISKFISISNSLRAPALRFPADILVSERIPVLCFLVGDILID